MIFEELTPKTRALMVSEFQAEQLNTSLPPFRPNVLTDLGESVFRKIMEEHLGSGSIESLTAALSPSQYWIERGIRKMKSGPVSFFMPGHQRAKVFALTDFNTWYVRALCAQLISEGHEVCEVYRAQLAYEPRGECITLEGKKLPVREVYEGHRARYYPENTANPHALSVPAGPNCHHSIRRTRAA